MPERIGSPDNDPAPRDGTAARGQVKPEGQARQDAPASVRPDDPKALKSAIAGAPDNDRAGNNNKPGTPEGFAAVKKYAAISAVAAIIAIQSYAAREQPQHDPTEGGHDRSARTAKADHGTAADDNADTCQIPSDQADWPSAGDRSVAEASAPNPADASLGEELKGWWEKHGEEDFSAMAEDLEKRKESPGIEEF